MTFQKKLIALKSLFNMLMNNHPYRLLLLIAVRRVIMILISSTLQIFFNLPYQEPKLRKKNQTTSISRLKQFKNLTRKRLTLKRTFNMIMVWKKSLMCNTLPTLQRAKLLSSLLLRNQSNSLTLKIC